MPKKDYEVPFNEIEWPEYRSNVVHVNSVYSVNTSGEGRFTPHNGAHKGRSISEDRKQTNREEPWINEINQHSDKPTVVEIELVNYRKQAFKIACRMAGNSSSVRTGYVSNSFSEL